MKARRPFPFTATHEWVQGCASCPFDHSDFQKDPSEKHCKKCGITLSRAKARELEIEVEACPIREIRKCQQCQIVSPISTESPLACGLCATCMYPRAPAYNTAEEAIKAMKDINAGLTPDSPRIPKKPEIN